MTDHEEAHEPDQDQDHDYKDANDLPTESSLPANLTKPQSKSNQQYIVPLGILIVLFTFYLSTSAFKRTNDIKEAVLNENLKNSNDLLHKQKTGEYESLSTDRNLIKLLEHDDKCYDLQIFTKHISTIFDVTDDDDDLLTEINTEDELKAADTIEELTNNKEITKKKIIVKIGVKSRKNGKTLKQKNGNYGNNFKNNNKSIKAKLLRKKVSPNKDTQPKKGSTAEPIIYLFALVFIYLLLKAASDINQHYKSQSKGDKRLRRCSLQSYAQAHKPDRRASKESPTKDKHFMMMETRSKSVDRYATDAEIARKNEMLSKLRRYTSVDEHQKQRKTVTPTWNYITANSSPTRTPTPPPLATDQCIENMLARTMLLNRQDSVPSLLSYTTVSSSSPSSPSRRCSIPISLNYQRLKLSTTPSVGIASTTRRTSITSGNIEVGSCDGTIGMKFPEVKRRVRMINRH